MAYKNDPVKIDKTLLNYSSQAIRDFYKHYNYAPKIFDIYPLVIKLLTQGVKFVLPDGAAVLTEYADGIRGKGGTLNLPYPITILEFPFSPNGRPGVGSRGVSSSRRITIAMNPFEIESSIYKKLLDFHAMADPDVEILDIPSIIDAEIRNIGDVIFVLDCFYCDEAKIWQCYPAINVLSGGCMSALRIGEMSKAEDDIDIYAGRDAVWSVYQLSAALSCNNVTTERYCSYPRALRRKNNKKKPIFEYHVLAIKPGKHSPHEAAGGTHASPRVHLRRGHRREYRSGLFTWVQPCVVGSKELGVIHKDYQIATTN